MSNALDTAYNIRITNLLGWRKRYKKSIYSQKVALNTFYDLQALFAFWEDKEIARLILARKKIFQEFEPAYKFVFSNYRKIQTKVVAPKFLRMLNDNLTILDLSWDSLLPTIYKANNGSDDHIERIERFYIQHGMSTMLVGDWLTLRFMGYSDHEAYNEVIETNTYINTNSLEEVYRKIYEDVRIYLFASPETKQISGHYQKLPNLQESFLGDLFKRGK